MSNLQLTIVIGHPLGLAIPHQASATVDTAHRPGPVWTTGTPQAPAPITPPVIS